MKNILFISEYPLDQSTSGCLHFFDIVKSTSKSNKTSHLYLEIYRRESSPFSHLALNKFVPLDNVAQQIKEIKQIDGITRYQISIDSYSDLDHFYTSELEAYLIQQAIRYRIYKLVDYLAEGFFRSFDAVIILLQESTSFFMAEHVCQKHFKVIPIYLDPLEMRHHIYKTTILSKSVIDKAKEEIFKNAKGFILPSESALNKILEHTNNKNITYAYPIIRDQKDIYFEKKNISIKERKEIKIVMVGQIYALEELLRFLNSLPLIRQKRNLNLLTFDYIGPNDGLKLIQNNLNYNPENEKISFNFAGPINHDKLINKIRGKFDFGYVPYPFNENMKETIGFSFPSKFVAYIESGIIPLYHGPGGSVSNFLVKNELDHLIIPSQSEKDISEFFDILFDDHIEFETISRLQALEKIFSEDTLSSNIKNLINELN
jgi:hypothetical protein